MMEGDVRAFYNIHTDRAFDRPSSCPSSGHKFKISEPPVWGPFPLFPKHTSIYKATTPILQRRVGLLHKLETSYFSMPI